VEGHISTFSAPVPLHFQILSGTTDYDNTFSRFHTIPERNGQADRFVISISRVSVLTRDKDCEFRFDVAFGMGCVRDVI